MHVNKLRKTYLAMKVGSVLNLGGFTLYPKELESLQIETGSSALLDALHDKKAHNQSIDRSIERERWIVSLLSLGKVGGVIVLPYRCGEERRKFGAGWKVSNDEEPHRQYRDK